MAGTQAGQVKLGDHDAPCAGDRSSRRFARIARRREAACRPIWPTPIGPTAICSAPVWSTPIWSIAKRGAAGARTDQGANRRKVGKTKTAVRKVGKAHRKQHVVRPPPNQRKLAEKNGYKRVSDLVNFPKFFPSLGVLFVKPETLPLGPFLCFDRKDRLGKPCIWSRQETLTITSYWRRRGSLAQRLTTSASTSTRVTPEWTCRIITS